MSWWNPVSVSNIASEALKKAQKKIDKVLDIQGEGGKDASIVVKEEVTVTTTDTSSPSSPTIPEDSEFWNTWLGSEKFAALGASAKAKAYGLQGTPSPPGPASEDDFSSSASEFFSSTISSSLSKVKSLQRKAEASSLLKKKSDRMSTSLTLATDTKRPLSEDLLEVDDRTSPSLSSPKLAASDQDTSEQDIDRAKPLMGTQRMSEPLRITVPETEVGRNKEVVTVGTGLLATVDCHKQEQSSATDGSHSPQTGTTESVAHDSDLQLTDADSLGADSAESCDPVQGTAIVPVTPDVSAEPCADDIISDNKDSALETIPAEIAPVQTVTDDKIVKTDGEHEIDCSLLEPEPSGWGEDVSLSLITDSQMSTASSTAADVTEITVNEDPAQPVCDREPDSNTVDSVVVPSDGVVIAAVEVGESISSLVDSGQGNAWDIPELTESTLESSSNELSIDFVDKAETVQEQEGTSHTVEVSSTADDFQLPAPDHECSDNSENPETTIVDSVAANVAPVMALDELPPSMEDSTETQEELSEGNRTLTTEEINQARMSSESSQATLELGPDDITERAAEDVDPEPTEMTSSQSNSDRGRDKTGSESGTSKENLTSSSYVKNMLEEAMVESMKDTDSHTDSHSSSDMVRIESGPTSGHTSADEIETNTSSDIEIISHISTPTPNGENRLFDLSPLRHALSRTMRRQSPPGHKRSDSSSSGQSRNGDDLLSPDGAVRPDYGARAAREARRDVKRETDEESNALATEKLLKEHHESVTMVMSAGQPQDHVSMVTPVVGSDAAFNPDPSTVTPGSVTLLVGPDAAASALNNLNKLQQKLAETAEILDVREKKLVDLSHENMDLVEVNNILRQQLEQSEEAREAEMTDLNTLTEEFTKRMGEAELKIQGVIREKEQMRKKLQDTEAELVKRANDKATERIMREKDQQIAELLEEGEKLSKQQLQVNNIIKKLRVKEKENDSLIKTQKQKVDNQEAEIEKLQKVLDNKVDNEKKQNDAISQLNNAVLVQESEINRLKSELEDSMERVRSMQVALDNSYKEIAELHRTNVSRASQMQEEALSVEITARKDLQVALEHYQQQARLEQEGLYTQIEDHQLSINRMEKEHGRREDILKQEIADLQQRLQDAEDRNQDLTHSVSQATRPLLRQIENLQSTYAAQVNSYERVERNLTERLAESQTNLALAQEKERSAKDSMIEVEVKLSTLETQVSKLRQEKSRLQAALEMERAKLEVLEDAKNNESAQLDALKYNFECEVNELKKEKILAENQLEMEKMKIESEKKKVSMLHEQLREKELQWVQARKANSPTPTAFSRENSFTVDLPLDSPMNLSQHEDVLEKTLMLASSNGSKTSLYESLRQAGATTIVESLQSQLKMRDGEILQLQSEIQELERTRESMARELVSLFNQNELLQEQVLELPEYQAKYKDLDQRYQALLQMYGEKVEEAQELRLDLQDIKDMYKGQINELLKNQ